MLEELLHAKDPMKAVLLVGVNAPLVFAIVFLGRIRPTPRTKSLRWAHLVRSRALRVVAVMVVEAFIALVTLRALLVPRAELVRVTELAPATGVLLLLGCIATVMSLFLTPRCIVHICRAR